MHQALTLGISPDVFDKIPETTIDALLTIEAAKGIKQNRQNKREEFYRSKGLKAWG